MPIQNSNGIIANFNAKPIVMKRPGNNQEYYLFTVGTDGNPYMHSINMNAVGYGNTLAMGEVVQKNIQLDNTGNYGYHSIGLEDALTDIHYMYTTRYTPPVTAVDDGNTELVAFEFLAGTTVPAAPEIMASIPGKDATGNGELHISADGKKIAYYSRKKKIGGFDHRATEINVFTFDPNNRKAIVPAETRQIADNGAGNFGKGGMDFAQGGDDIYLAQHGIYMQDYGSGNLSEKNIFQYNVNSSHPVTGRTLAVTYTDTIQYGEVRRAKDGFMYIPGIGNDSYFTTLGGSGTALLDSTSGYKLTGNFPAQLFKVGSTETPASIVRTVGKKQYELVDHLSNVRAVVSDRRGADIDVNGDVSNYASIETFTDYYAFGSQMPGRSYNSGDYRYGFNGMQKDDEIKGIGVSYTTDFRQFDSRIAKWLSIDPEFRAFPWQSPYVSFDNNPIFYRDPKGLAAEGGGEGMKKKGEGKCENCEDQALKDGQGNVEKQQFSAITGGTKEEFEKFKEAFTKSPQKITNNRLATYVPVDLDESGDFSEGDHIDIDILGPDNGTVRVAKIIIEEDHFELYFQALKGHPDAGNIRFTGTFVDGKITFEVFNITRTSIGWYSDAVPFGFIVAPALARSAQKTQWRSVLVNYGVFMGKPIQMSENIREYYWDSKKQAIGKEIE